MKPLSERIKDFPADQFVDWLCLSCVDVREVRNEEDAQDEINKIRKAVTERLTALEKQRDALAAENVLMLKLLTDISENHVEYFSEGEGYTLAGVPLDYVSEINTYVSRDVNAENPFPATDACLTSVRAEAVPEGYVLVPQQMHLSADAMESLCFHCGDGGFAFGDFTDGLLWVGDIENDDGTKTYGLNIATAEYPEEGSANVSEFAVQLRAGKDGE